jgi:hypothetical protein
MLREKIFRMGIPACDLFFAYLTPNSTNSSWCRDELDAAFIQTYESKGVLVALFVDSDATRNTLRADLQTRRSPVLNDAHYWPAILELSSAAWLALQGNGRVVGRKGTVDVRVEPFASNERYHWKSLLDRVHRDLFIVGANLRSWLSNEEARQALLSLLESQRKPRLTLILGTPEILRDLGGGSCTCTLRINPTGSPVDFHKGKKA